MSRETDIEAAQRRSREDRALAMAYATERDRQVRLQSVARDIQLDLPVSVPQPDGEEFPRRCQMQLRSYDQRSEIVKSYIQGPPNKTICNSSAWDSNGGGFELKATTSKSNSCSCLNPESTKSHSTGQLNSWNFLKSSSTGKSPHLRSGKCHVHSPRAQKERTSSASLVTSKHKTVAPPVTPSSSPCSSVHSSSNTLSTVTTTVTVHTPSTTTQQSHSKTSIGEKIQNMFSDKEKTPAPSIHATSSSGMFARLLEHDNKKSKSSKLAAKGSGGFGSALKADLKKLPTNILPETETQVYMMIPKEVSSGGNLGKSNGAGSSRPLMDYTAPLSGYTEHEKVDLNRQQASLISYESRPSCDERLGSTQSHTTSDKNGNARVLSSSGHSESPWEPQRPGSGQGESRRESDIAGGERERAYSDSMVRNLTDRSCCTQSTLTHRSEISESRMSLCIEGDDGSSVGDFEVPSGTTSADMTESSPGRPSTESNTTTTAQESPSSFLYHHHIHHQNESQEGIVAS